MGEKITKDQDSAETKAEQDMYDISLSDIKVDEEYAKKIRDEVCKKLGLKK